MRTESESLIDLTFPLLQIHRTKETIIWFMLGSQGLSEELSHASAWLQVASATGTAASGPAHVHRDIQSIDSKQSPSISETGSHQSLPISILPHSNRPASRARASVGVLPGPAGLEPWAAVFHLKYSHPSLPDSSQAFELSDSVNSGCDCQMRRVNVSWIQLSHY
jgi:hypothetical protein